MITQASTQQVLMCQTFLAAVHSAAYGSETCLLTLLNALVVIPSRPILGSAIDHILTDSVVGSVAVPAAAPVAVFDLAFTRRKLRYMALMQDLVRQRLVVWFSLDLH
jgi:hypothetical protein